MSDPAKPGDTIQATITGDVSGQVAVGKDIAQQQTVTGLHALSPAEFDELRRSFAALREQVAAQAPPDKKDAALERVGELEQAVAEPEPDLTTMEYVKRWFVKHLPALAGAVTAVVVNPIVGKLVQAAGDALAAEFKRRFGPG